MDFVWAGQQANSLLTAFQLLNAMPHLVICLWWGPDHKEVSFQGLGSCTELKKYSNSQTLDLKLIYPSMIDLVLTCASHHLSTELMCDDLPSLVKSALALALSCLPHEQSHVLLCPSHSSRRDALKVISQHAVHPELSAAAAASLVAICSTVASSWPAILDTPSLPPDLHLPSLLDLLLEALTALLTRASAAAEFDAHSASAIIQQSTTTLRELLASGAASAVAMDAMGRCCGALDLALSWVEKQHPAIGKVEVLEASTGVSMLVRELLSCDQVVTSAIENGPASRLLERVCNVVSAAAQVHMMWASLLHAVERVAMHGGSSFLDLLPLLFCA